MKGCDTRTAGTPAASTRARALLRAGVVLLAAAALGACEKDTLYQVENGQININTTPLTVSVQTISSPRMERTDTVYIKVIATDPTGQRGIATIGATALIEHADGTTNVLSDSLTFDPPESGSVTHTFALATPTLTFPDTLSMEVFGFAVDATGNCVASVQEQGQRIACGSQDGATIAAQTVGQTAEVIAVRGQTVRLPTEGTIADAAVDVSRRKLYLSNLTLHRLEVLDLANQTFQPFVEVGSQPWGLAISGNGNTLFVANSGGTSISYVSLNTLTEDVARRLKTPNEVLWQITLSKNVDLLTRYLPHFIDFSDRPEFLAQDYTGRILYSTLPTEVAPLGTIRWVDPDPDPASTTDTPEVRFLFTTDAITPAENSWAIAQIDSVQVLTSDVANDLITLFDHNPGHPTQIIKVGPLPITAAVDSMAKTASDIIASPGTWNTSVLGYSDTTYVSVSGDRHWVAFGEGATAPAGRIVLFDAANNRVSRAISVVDLVDNASERVNGVDLDYDGQFGVARGAFAAYFFDNDLRLQGMFAPDIAGGAGAALQPTTTSATPAYAFVGSSVNSVKVIDTTHFLERAEIPIKDNIIGPLRASGPLAGDNSGLSCGSSPDPDCVVAKVYGITSGGGVVILNILAADLQ